MSALTRPLGISPRIASGVTCCALRALSDKSTVQEGTARIAADPLGPPPWECGIALGDCVRRGRLSTMDCFIPERRSPSQCSHRSGPAYRLAVSDSSIPVTSVPRETGASSVSGTTLDEVRKALGGLERSYSPSNSSGEARSRHSALDHRTGQEGPTASPPLDLQAHLEAPLPRPDLQVHLTTRDLLRAPQAAARLGSSFISGRDGPGGGVSAGGSGGGGETGGGGGRRWTRLRPLSRVSLVPLDRSRQTFLETDSR